MNPTQAASAPALAPAAPDPFQPVLAQAAWLAEQGEYAAARPLYEQALAGYAQALGPDHPTTQAVRQSLTWLRARMDEG